MSNTWKDIKGDWHDLAVVPAVRYPSTWVAGASAGSIDVVIATVESFNPRISTPGEIIDSLNNSLHQKLNRGSI